MMVFSIKKGKHYSNNLIHKILLPFNYKNKVSYYVTFDESCIYKDETNDRFDVNKLFGFSIGFHHKNSHRFGWNCLDGKIHIYSYSYINGERIINEICTVNTNKEYKFIIHINGSKCLFTIIDEHHNLYQRIISIPIKSIFGYSLWPYFGGNKTAPHKMTIELGETDDSF